MFERTTAWRDASHSCETPTLGLEIEMRGRVRRARSALPTFPSGPSEEHLQMDAVEIAI